MPLQDKIFKHGVMHLEEKVGMDLNGDGKIGHKKGGGHNDGHGNNGHHGHGNNGHHGHGNNGHHH